jgi:hypothetical protein
MKYHNFDRPNGFLVSFSVAHKSLFLALCLTASVKMSLNEFIGVAALKFDQSIIN